MNTPIRSADEDAAPNCPAVTSHGPDPGPIRSSRAAADSGCRDETFRTYREADVDALLADLARADLVIGFNSIRFDYKVLQGYTDERGTEEYNLALGERRANSVKRYLESLGVPGSRIDTVSFGEADPAVPGHDESAWRWNRRVQFHVTR